MNDIRKRDVETYVRNLISETFDIQSDIRGHDRQHDENIRKTSTPKQVHSETTQRDK
jgi:hypothetical protein